MKTNVVPSTSALEVLRNDNYADWSAGIKNHLLVQGLWDIVETTMEPPKPEDDAVEFEAWRKKNDAALVVIQSSCGIDILSQINKVSLAKIAWQKLDKMFKQPWQGIHPMVEQGSSSNVSASGQDMPTRTGANEIFEEGNTLRNSDSTGQVMPNRSTGASQIFEDGNTLNNSDSEQNIPNWTGANQIFEEGNSSNNTGRTNDHDYAVLVKAVRSGDWNTAIDFLELHPDALTARILVSGKTVLHAAVGAELSKDIEVIVEKLVDMISERGLPLTVQNYSGVTVLHEAITSGNLRMVKCLVGKSEELVSIADWMGLPVVMAMRFGKKEIARYLYRHTPFEILKAEHGRQGSQLLTRAIYNRDIGMALDLMEKCPRLAFGLDRENNASPLSTLASLSTDAFESGNRLVFWKRWIYNHCIHNSCASATDDFRQNIQNGDQEETIDIGSVRARLHQLLSSLLNLLGLKRLYEMKLVHAQFQQLLDKMCEVIASSTSPDHDSLLSSSAVALFRAISAGNFEFFDRLGKTNSELLLIMDSKRRTIFHCAVLHRQPRIFSLIYGLKKRNSGLTLVDNSKNTILHMAGILTKITPIDHIRGAALQMQREVQWFKEVESICHPVCKELLNNDGLSPRQLFKKDHQELRKEGERWMKDTATSCTVVGALIITIMFTAAFTVPGGNYQDTGFPILVHNKLFQLFIVTDSLSLFSSSTSVLMFLGILTSRYAEEDFLVSLPRKMIIGLFALFFSITTMMIAFSVALLLMLRGEYWIIVPTISLAGVPIILFVLMQFRLLVDMLVSTYGPSIIDKKMKPWF